MIGLEAGVGVPAAGAAVAVVDLHEPDASLDEPTGRQHLPAEVVGFLPVEPVHPTCISAVSPANRTTSGTAVCMRKASSYDLIRARSLGLEGYSTAERRLSRPKSSAFMAASFGPSGTPGRAKGQGVGRVDFERHARVLGAEVVGVGGSQALVFEKQGPSR